MTSFEADVADSFPRPPARHTSDDEFHVERLLLNVGHGSQRLLGERTTAEQMPIQTYNRQTARERVF